MKNLLVGLAIAVSVLPTITAAQTSGSSAPIRVVLPFGPGSGTDNIARPLLEAMSRQLERQFIVDNRPGANGFLAATAVARAAPDGQTLLFTTSTTQTINPMLFKHLPYDPNRDFRPIGSIMESYYVLVVSKEMPARTVGELTTWVKAHPNTAAYAWGAAVSQVTGATFVQKLGLPAAGVPYKSSPQAVTDLIGGQVSFMFLDLAAAMSFITGGQLRPLAVTSAKRVKQLPEVPTMAEVGMPLEVVTWGGLFAPARTPDSVVEQLSNAMRSAAQDPLLQKQIDLCCSLMVSAPAEFGAYIQRDRDSWSTRVPAAGITPQ